MSVDIFDPPAISELVDLDHHGDHPCRTAIVGGHLVVTPLTDPDDLADYYEAMHEEDFDRCAS
jgi:hypothetical protein